MAQFSPPQTPSLQCRYLGETLLHPPCCRHTVLADKQGATAEPHAGRSPVREHVPSNTPVLGTLVLPHTAGHVSSQGCWHTKQLYCGDPRCLQGWKLQDKLQKSRGKVETSTKLLTYLLLPLSPHPPIHQYSLYQLHGRGASFPYQRYGGTCLISCPLLLSSSNTDAAASHSQPLRHQPSHHSKQGKI